MNAGQSTAPARSGAATRARRRPRGLNKREAGQQKTRADQPPNFRPAVNARSPAMPPRPETRCRISATASRRAAPRVTRSAAGCVPPADAAQRQPEGGESFEGRIERVGQRRARRGRHQKKRKHDDAQPQKRHAARGHPAQQAKHIPAPARLRLCQRCRYVAAVFQRCARRPSAPAPAPGRKQKPRRDKASGQRRVHPRETGSGRDRAG